MLNKIDFLVRLDQEVKLQSKIEENHLLPNKLGSLGRFVATYPWQFTLFLSLVSAGVAVLLKI